MIEMVWPTFLADMPVPEQMALYRKIVQNNGISHLNAEISTDETFLPRILVNLGLFPSVNQVRKNRPKYFRDVAFCETVKVGRFNIQIWADTEDGFPWR
jgi:hypothetical protein